MNEAFASASSVRQPIAALAGAFVAALALAGCASPQLADYAAQRPEFDFKNYFNGTVLAHGVASDRSGKVLRRFSVTMRCDWVGDAGTLDEQFVYDDGQRERRIWRIRAAADGSFIGTADDVVGEARGAQSGSAFHWRYTLKLPVRGSVYEIGFDDWMHRIDDRVVINKAVMSKFGFRVGEVLLSFNKP